MARLKAGSILEATVALSIVAIVFTVGWMTVETVFTANQPIKKHRLYLALKAVAADTKTQKRWINEEIDSNVYWISKEVIPSEWGSAIYLLHCSAFSLDNQLLLQHKELVYVEE